MCRGLTGTALELHDRVPEQARLAIGTVELHHLDGMLAKIDTGHPAHGSPTVRAAAEAVVLGSLTLVEQPADALLLAFACRLQLGLHGGRQLRLVRAPEHLEFLVTAPLEHHAEQSVSRKSAANRAT
jgi:hypothetical protein